MADRNKFILAVILAAVGVFLAVWTYRRNTVVAPSSQPAARVLTATEQRNQLSIRTDTFPTSETLEAVCQQATDRMKQGLKAIHLPLEKPDDLTAAFSEHLRATLEGDYERRSAELRSRGLKHDFSSPNVQRPWVAAAAMTHLAPLGLSELVVEMVYINGKRVKADEIKSGWSRSEQTQADQFMPIKRDIEGQKLTIIEIRLPMQLSKAPSTVEKGTAVVGYRFAWNREAKQWVPWSTVVLYVEDEAFFGPPM